MKNIDKEFFILTISKKDPEGLIKTIKSVSKLKSNFKLVHIVKIFSSDSESIDSYESENLKRIIISGKDSGIYNSMNIILGKVPINTYAIFLNSGDTIEGILEINDFKNNDDYILINTYKGNDNKENLIKIKNTFFDGMPFCHQSLIFKKKFGMSFCEKYKICGDYEFVLKWLKKNYESPLSIKKVFNLKTVFDINGISSKKRFKRDFEGFMVILCSQGLFKSFIYLANRIKRYMILITT